jgi:hypothetical protein
VTTTLSAQARLDQLNAERDELIKQAAREDIQSALLTLSETCLMMASDINDDNIERARSLYEGSTAGQFWGPVNRIKKGMGKLK